MPGSFYIKVKQPGAVSRMGREELIALHWRKDRYIDKMHRAMRDLEKVIYSSRSYQHELRTCIENLHETIDCLKLKVFTLTGRQNERNVEHKSGDD